MPDVKHSNQRNKRYKFLNFSEQLANVSVDAVHKIKRNTATSENEDSSHFASGLVKWRSLDKTINFESFYADVADKSKNFKMVIYYEQQLVKAMKKHLLVEKTLALQSLLDLLPLLAYDLGMDFYKHLPDFFEVFIKLAKTKSVDKMEWIFFCISKLFKCMWKQMIEDMANIIRMYSAFLSGDFPEHIVAFAAESISFLVRKCKNINEVIEQLFEYLEVNPVASDGISKIISSVIKGTKGKLHSTSADIIPIVLDQLNNDEKIQAENCIITAFDLILDHVDMSESEIISHSLQTNALNLSPNNFVVWRRLLNICTAFCKAKGGSKVGKAKPVLDILGAALLCKTNDLDTNILDLLSVILTSTKIQISEHQIDQILIAIFSEKKYSADVLYEFWPKLFQVAKRNESIKQHFFKCCSSNLKSVNDTIFLTLICSYFLSCSNVSDFENFSPLNMDMSILRAQNDFKLDSIVKEILTETDDRNYALSWCCCKIINHMGTKERMNFLNLVIEKIKFVLNKIAESAEDKDKKIMFPLLLATVETTALIKPKAFKSISTKLMVVLEKHIENLNVMLALDIILKKNPEFIKKLQNNCEFFNKIAANLSNPLLKLRLISLSVLCKIKPDCQELALCYNAESTPATLQDYRGRLLHISKLRKHDEMDGATKEAVLRFLLGNLYINLAVYWPVVQEVIAIYLSSNDPDIWKVYLAAMNSATENAKLIKWWNTNKNQTPEEISSKYLCENEHISALIVKFSVPESKLEVHSKPDRFNYRLLLWSNLSQMSDFNVQENVRDHLIASFFDYLETEHILADAGYKSSLHYNKSNEVLSTEGKRKHLAIKTLETILTTFEKFTSYKLFKEHKQLKDVYYSLLSHDNSSIQKKSCACAILYLKKGYQEIKEYLHDLLDDQKLKDLALGNNFDEMGAKQRSAVMPLVMRVLYGRLLSHDKFHSGGKGYAKMRKAVILKLISRLGKAEVENFIKFILQPLAVFDSQNHEQTTSAEKVTVPLNQQMGVINTLQLFVSKYASLIPDVMYESMLVIGCNLLKEHNTLQKTDAESHDALPLLRKISKKVFNFITSLIEYWPPNHEMTDRLKDEIFHSIVAPNADKLKHECLNQPNATFCLIKVFAKHNKFSDILSRRISDNFMSCVHVVIDILSSQHVTNAGAKNVMEFLSDILREEEDEGEDENTKGKLSQAKALELVVPHTEVILNYFILSLQTKKKNPLVLQNLSVLKLVGSSITKSELAVTLAELILAQVFNIVKNRKLNRQAEDRVKESSVLPLLQVLENLSGHEKFIPDISKMFLCLHERKTRNALVNIFCNSCESVTSSPQKLDSMKWSSNLIARLNAWDKKFFEEVDFDLRLTAFQELQQYFQREDIQEIFDLEQMLPILNCSIYTMFKFQEDISLRECAARSLDSFIKVAAVEKDGVPVCKEAIVAILDFCKQGVNCTMENVRQEALKILATCVRLMPQNQSLKGLLSLCNDSDPDSDFFENICHLQMHRKTRALRKLADILESEDPDVVKLPFKVVYNYLTPIALQMVKEDIKKYQHFEIECLRVVTNTARLMPWTEYRVFLGITLQWMHRDFVSMKIICAALKGFNFDLSSIVYNKPVKASNKRSVWDYENEIENEEDATETSSSEKPSKNLFVNPSDNTFSGNPADVETLKVILNVILPKLTDGLSAKLTSDDSHKMAQKGVFSDAEQCEMRTPLAVAVANILPRLPVFVVQRYLPQILLKILVFLRHRVFDVRDIASKALAQIAVAVGVKYLYIILGQLKNGLCRGYQRHVLIHSIHTVLSKLELKCGDLDSCLSILQPILNSALFANAETEINKSMAKTPENRGKNKAFSSYKIISKYIIVNSLVTMIKPIRDTLNGTNSHKVKRTIEKVFLEINDGLMENETLTTEDRLLFVHGIITNNTKDLFKDKQKNPKKKEEEKLSCLLLSQEPERYDHKEVNQGKTSNLHVLVEFGLKMLNSLLKQQLHICKNHVDMLDPLVEILVNCVSSTYTKVVADSVRCLTKLIAIKLPSLNEHFEKLNKGLFKILQENSKGLGNQEIAATSFKALSILCISDQGTKFTNTQLEVLLAYAETDLYNTQRQAHAFNLLKSILRRGLKGDDVDHIMRKVRKIAIQSQDDAAMVQARQAYIYYLLNYSFTKNKLLDHLSFILAQFEYEYESGRLSALELVSSLTNSLPKDVFQKVSGLIFVSTSVLLVNESSSKCKRYALELIKSFLRKVGAEEKEQFLDMTIQWYSHKDKPSELQLAAILTGVFAEVYGTSFIRSVDQLLPCMINTIENLMLMQKDEDSTANVDHALFYQFSSFLDVIKACSLQSSLCANSYVNAMFELVEGNLLHPHDWIRVVCCQIFGAYFNNWTNAVDFVKEENKLTMFEELREKLCDLGKKFCEQLRSEKVHEQLSLQIVKNVLFVVKSLNELKETQEEDNVGEILRLIVSAATFEISYNPHCTSKRTIVLKLCSAIAMSFPQSNEHLELILEPIFREQERIMQDQDENEKFEALKTLANEAMELVKNVVGNDTFITAFSNVQKKIRAVRLDRKKKRAMEIVSNPHKAAIKKAKLHQKKKEVKKRKNANFKLLYHGKKKKET